MQLSKRANYCVNQGLSSYRLTEEICSAEHGSVLDTFPITARRKHDHGDGSRNRIAFDGSKQFKTVDMGHIQIQQYKIWAFGQNRTDRLSTIHTTDRIVAGVTQIKTVNIAIGVTIFNKFLRFPPDLLLVRETGSIYF